VSQKIYAGYGSHKELRTILQARSPQNIFFVIGRDSYSLSGAQSLVGDILKDYNHIVFSNFEVNPKLEDITKGIELFKYNGCDFVIGIGGGSVIDLAKSVSFIATQKGDTAKIVRSESEVSSREITSLIIPTTAGTGSESTHFSVVYINKEKFSLAHISIVPDYAILDPTFTEKLPPYITACTGMDALCQGIESFWSVKSSDESREYSKKAIELSLENIKKAVNNPDKNSREKMLFASNYSGRAINIAQTTIAHAVSYPFTAYFNIPHGHAVALTLPHFIEFNSQVDADSVQDIRGLSFVKQRMSELIERIGEASALDAKNKILSIMNNIGLETKLSNLGFSEKDIDIVIKNGFNPQRVKNNPRILTENQLRKLLIKLL
jgi:alcohol dehydrogenase class IV